jgi:GntR family transcriptional regulator/MocR family aminotransferase
VFLELDGEGPNYAQLIRAIKAAIVSGRMSSGVRLPSTRALARELGLSRITVLAAYEQLRAEGYVESRVGSGSYVNSLRTEPALKPPANEPIAPPSRYAGRARAVQDRLLPRIHLGVRFDLQYGEPQINPALNAIWGRELARAATYTPMRVSLSQGHLPLREQICRYLALRRGVQVAAEQVLIVSGSQQAIALTARVLIDEGDAAVIEDPHYFGAWQELTAHGACLVPVATDHEGLICAQLPKSAPRLIYVTPSHQFPAGSTLSLSRRLELLRYAEANQCWVVEDDYDSEFRYDAHPLAALRSLDHGDRVIYIGTFSKVLSGALRLGYMVLPTSLRDDFVNAKFLCGFGCPTLEQAALAHFMENGGFERHLRRSTKVLRARREALIAGLHHHAGKRVQVADSHAGMHVVIWLPDYSYAQIDVLIAMAHEAGLGLYPMAPHYHFPPAIPGLMLGYCNLSTTDIEDAMCLFGECLDAIDASVLSPT